MAEAIFGRMKRIVSAGLEGVTDSVERVSGPLVMREAIREVDRTADRVAAARDKARARRSLAVARQRLLREQLGTLQEQARFAVVQGREDLAQIALSRQLDLEGQVQSLDKLIGDAGREEAALEEQFAELTARKEQMKREYAMFEAAQRGAPDGTAGLHGKTTRRVAQAEATFERAMSAVAGADFGLSDAASAAAVSEVEEMQRQAALDKRLAELRASVADPASDGGKASGRKRGSKS